MSQSLYLIDGHAQIYRAYYAPFAGLSAATGEPTKATHAFWQMVFNLVRDRKPDYLALVLDVSDETVFRREVYPEYKAHREAPPEDLGPQIDRIIEFAQTLRIPTLRLPGFEADDLLATLACRHASEDLHVYLVSKDKDLEQVLSKHVSLFDAGRNEVITPERLFELKGWRPHQAIEAQILIGDSVDNVPGVPGIGPKTAAKLIAQYGTARGVVEHAHELTPKQRENVLAFAPHMERTRELVTLRCDAPVTLDLDAARVEGFAWSALADRMRSLGFRRLPEQAPFQGRGGGASAPAPAPSAAPAAKPAAPRPAASLFDMLDAPPTNTPETAPATTPDEVMPAEPQRMATRFSTPEFNRLIESALPLAMPVRGDYRLIDTPAALRQAAQELSSEPALAIDTETTGLNPIDADLIGIALSARRGTGYYVALRGPAGPILAPEVVKEILGPLLSDPARLKVGHNLKYDLIVLRQAGLEVGGPLFDTMVAAFALDPLASSFKLDLIVERVLGHRMIPITDLIGRGRDQLRMDRVPLDQVCEYAAEDADYTWRLYEAMAPAIRESDRAGLFFEVEMPLLRVLTDMEYAGVAVDAGVLDEMKARMQQRVRELTDRVYALAGRPFNLDSPKQLAEVLFDEMKLRVVRRTRTGRSTDAETLETLYRETQHELLKLLLEHREIQKLLGTYVEALPRAASPRTGRVHTSFHQTGAVTGRLSSSEPNLQNIPVRTELGREIRRAFVARSPAERLIVADYSQIELRVLAHFCEDAELIRAFAEDRDIHAFVASQVNNVPLEEVTRAMRSRAKAVNFGLIYGQTAFGLAAVTGMSRTEAQAFINAYFQRYPRIRGFIAQCVEDAKRDGYVRTVLGRRRPIPDIESRSSTARAQAERLAVNTVIQGSAADMIKIAMVRLHNRIAAESLPLRLILQVHDELVCEAPTEHAEQMARVVAAEMSGAMELRVPLKVDACVASNWLEAE